MHVGAASLLLVNQRALRVTKQSGGWGGRYYFSDTDLSLQGMNYLSGNLGVEDKSAAAAGSGAESGLIQVSHFILINFLQR